MESRGGEGEKEEGGEKEGGEKRGNERGERERPKLCKNKNTFFFLNIFY